MVLLQANNIHKSYGARILLDFPELIIHSGDRIGLIGANGCGKSTLLEILAGTQNPDQGTIVRTTPIVFLRQILQPTTKLSGGEQQKEQILKFAQDSQKLLLADEPTANLDAQGRQWLEAELHKHQTFLVVSHDRALLDQLCTKIIAIEDGTLHCFTGNFSDYLTQKQVAQNKKQEQYEQYLFKKRQLKQAAEVKQANLARQIAKKKKDHSSEARLGKHHRNAIYKKIEREAKILQQRAQRLEPVDRVKESPRIKLDFSLTNPPQNKRVITASNLSFGYGSKKLFQNASLEVFGGEHLAICGPNGCGKTTLLKLILQGEPSIKLAPKLKPGTIAQDFSSLNPQKTVLENVLSTNIQTRETVFEVLSELLFTKEAVHKKAHVLSGGEHVRLNLAKLILSDSNALFLDEPTNFLDIQSLQALERTLQAYPGTIVLVSHDAEFVRTVATRQLWIRNQKLEEAQEAAATSDLQRLTLDMERSRIAQKLDSTQGAEKDALEQEYFALIRQLRELDA